ncbi:MAG: 4Fe-4S binding protein [Victivallales bacterium]|jgi:anaerobic sulfite reductase subunit C|nr:4Fe-4S binding protein [Victivallales bacterium]MBT7301149.1 4Fe-4S binding protein [Victivallales bacterium]
MATLGIVKQRNPDLCALRLKAIGGDLTTEQLRTIVGVAERYGEGKVHVSTRQGMEIHGVEKARAEEAIAQLAAGGVPMGAGGNRVRVICACPGETWCRYGAINTKDLAAALDREHFASDTPYKVKMNVTGCPNNCGKARENDIGMMGVTVPAWSKSKCTDCGKCIPLCPTEAIRKVGDDYVCDDKLCINCSVCPTLCPAGAWEPATTGIRVLAGGTMGKKPRLGTVVADLLQDPEEALALVRKIVAVYRAEGRPKERLGHTMDRIGLEEFNRRVAAES